MNPAWKTMLSWAAFAAAPAWAGQGGLPRQVAPLDVEARVEAAFDDLEGDEFGPLAIPSASVSTLSFSNASGHLMVIGSGATYRVQGAYRDDQGAMRPFNIEGRGEDLECKLKALPKSFRALVLWQVEADRTPDLALAPNATVAVPIAPNALRMAPPLAPASSPIEALAIAGTNGRYKVEGAYRDAAGKSSKFRCEGSPDQVRGQLPAAIRDEVMRQLSDR
jgi:hypothetical protein